MNYDWIYFLGGLVVGGSAAFLVTRFYMLNRRVLTKADKEMLDRQDQDP